MPPPSALRSRYRSGRSSESGHHQSQCCELFCPEQQGALWRKPIRNFGADGHKDAMTGSAINVTSACEVAQAASENLIADNTVQGAAPGIVLEATVTSASTCGPQVNSNLVEKNSVTDQGGDTGILIYQCSGQSYTAKPPNVIEDNSVSGYALRRGSRHQ